MRHSDILLRKGRFDLCNKCDSASKIGDGKDLSKRINLQGSPKDEMYHLAQTFDKMFERLESFESEKQFTSDASHELRTPTSVIISQCEYALSQRNNPKWKNR